MKKKPCVRGGGTSGWMSLAGAFGAFMSAWLYDLTGGYKAGLAFSMATVFIAVSPLWLRGPLSRHGTMHRP